MIVAQGPLQRLNDLAPMLRLLHVDEVDDDDAAEIAQAQLPRNGHRRLEVGAKYGFLSKLRWPTKAPVFTSTVVIASV